MDSCFLGNRTPQSRSQLQTHKSIWINVMQCSNSFAHHQSSKLVSSKDYHTIYL
jgi:hypothetical protein